MSPARGCGPRCSSSARGAGPRAAPAIFAESAMQYLHRLLQQHQDEHLGLVQSAQLEHPRRVVPEVVVLLEQPPDLVGLFTLHGGGSTCGVLFLMASVRSSSICACGWENSTLRSSRNFNFCYITLQNGIILK